MVRLKVLGSFIHLFEIHNLPFPVLPIAVGEEADLWPIDQFRILGVWTTIPISFVFNKTRVPRGKIPSMLTKILTKAGSKSFPLRSSMNPKIFSETKGKSIVHPRPHQGIIKIGERDDPSEKGDLFLSGQFRVACQIVFEVVFEGSHQSFGWRVLPTLSYSSRSLLPRSGWARITLHSSAVNFPSC